MIRRLSLLFVLAIASAASPIARAQADGAGQTVPIKFDRPFLAGQAFSLSVEDTTKTTQTSALPDGTSQKSETFLRFNIEGDLTVKKLDDQGQEAQSELVLKKFTQLKTDPAPGGAAAATQVTRPIELIPTGVKVTITYTPTAVTFTLDKGTPSTDAKAGLSQIFKAHLVNDDERFGAAGEKKVGDAWPININTMVAALKSQGITADKIAGIVTLRALNPVNGVPCAQVEVQTTIRDMPVPGLPTGGVAKEFSLNSTALSDLPVDLALPRLGSAVKSNTHLVIETQSNGSVIRTTVDSEKTKVTAMTPKK